MRRWILGLVIMVSMLAAATTTIQGQAAVCLDETEMAMVAAINEYRATIGLPALEPSLEFTEAADYHTAYMIANQDFNHYLSGEQRSWWEVAQTLGAESVHRGENISWGHEDVPTTLEWWLRYGLQKGNHIANPNFTVIGVSRVIGPAPVAGREGETATWAVTFGDTLTTSIAGCAPPSGELTPPATPTPEPVPPPVPTPVPEDGGGTDEGTTAPPGPTTWCTEFAMGEAVTRQCGELTTDRDYQFVTVIDGQEVTIILQADNTLVVNVSPRSEEE